MLYIFIPCQLVISPSDIAGILSVTAAAWLYSTEITLIGTFGDVQRKDYEIRNQKNLIVQTTHAMLLISESTTY